jgi:predicted PurR-regulated permease PerM
LAYLFLTVAEFLKLKIDVFLDNYCEHHKSLKFLKKFIGLNFIIIALYIIFIGIIVFIVSDMIPKLINELSELPKNIPFLAEPVASVTNKLVEIKNFNSEL